MSVERPRSDSAREALVLRASRHPLAAEVAASLRRGGVRQTDRLALLVSGGGDSMAMLLLLAAIRERSDSALDSLAVLSVDHRLRTESAAECASALEFARTLGITRREVVEVDVARVGNLLDAARAARLSAAQAFVARHTCSAAALAHTADDRAESLLLGLMRGAGLAAATRLVPRRTLGDQDGLVLVRPLLGVTRRALRDFLRELGVSWHDDPSNALHDRGALRSDPSIARLVERMALGASRLGDEATECLDLCNSQLAHALIPSNAAIPRAAFDALPRALQRAALRSLAASAGAAIPAVVATRALDHVAAGNRSPLRLACADGWELVLDARELRLASLRKAVAAESIGHAGDDAVLDLEHHR